MPGKDKSLYNETFCYYSTNNNSTIHHKFKYENFQNSLQKKKNLYLAMSIFYILKTFYTGFLQSQKNPMELRGECSCIGA